MGSRQRRGHTIGLNVVSCISVDELSLVVVSLFAVEAILVTREQKLKADTQQNNILLSLHMALDYLQNVDFARVFRTIHFAGNWAR